MGGFSEKVIEKPWPCLWKVMVSFGLAGGEMSDNFRKL
jgi:hypothetical protein